jgi:carbamoylphosphate synthase large subunit
MNSELVILITSVGGELTCQFIKTLRESTRHKFRIIGVDNNEDVVARHILDQFEVVPLGTHQDYPDKISSICKKHGVDLIFPCSDEEALALAKVKDHFTSNNITLACNDIEVLEIISDKVLTYELLSSLNINLPTWHKADTIELVEAYVDKIYNSNGAVVVKIPSGRGGRGVYVIKDDIKGIIKYDGTPELHMDKESFIRNYLSVINLEEPVMVMEKLEEPAHDLDILAWNGDAIHLIPRKRLHSAKPNEGHVIVENELMNNIGQQVVSELCMSWIIDIDFMIMANGKPGVLEINPRPSGSLSVPICAGIPIFDDMVSLIKGEKIYQASIPTGKVIYPYKSLGTVD